jgi:hypothetical protein
MGGRKRVGVWALVSAVLGLLYTLVQNRVLSWADTNYVEPGSVRVVRLVVKAAMWSRLHPAQTVFIFVALWVAFVASHFYWDRWKARRAVRIEPKDFCPIRYAFGDEAFLVLQDVQITASPSTAVSVNVFFEFKETLPDHDYVHHYKCPSVGDEIPGWRNSKWDHHLSVLLKFPLNLAVGDSARGYVGFRVWRGHGAVPESRNAGWLRFVDNHTQTVLLERYVTVFAGTFDVPLKTQNTSQKLPSSTNAERLAMEQHAAQVGAHARRLFELKTQRVDQIVKEHNERIDDIAKEYHRRESIRKWRDMVTMVHKQTREERNRGRNVTELLELHPDFLSIRPHLSKSSQDVVWGRSFITSEAASTMDTKLVVVLQDIERLEREWKLI